MDVGCHGDYVDIEDDDVSSVCTEVTRLSSSTCSRPPSHLKTINKKSRKSAKISGINQNTDFRKGDKGKFNLLTSLPEQKDEELSTGKGVKIITDEQKLPSVYSKRDLDMNSENHNNNSNNEKLHEESSNFSTSSNKRTPKRSTFHPAPPPWVREEAWKKQGNKQTEESDHEFEEDLKHNLPVLRTLNMPSELDQYMERLRCHRRRSDVISRTTLPTLNLGILSRAGGPITRPHSPKRPLMERQKTRFGKDALIREYNQGRVPLMQRIQEQKTRISGAQINISTLLLPKR